MKLITVVICTYNRSGYLNLCLQSFVKQTLDQKFFNIIVVDNNSIDNTKKIVDKFLNILPVRYVFEKKQGASYARNKGTEYAKTKYIAYLDDDAQADKNLLNKACEIINNKKLNIFGGSIYPYYESKKPKWFKDKYETRLSSKKSGYLNNNQFLSGSNLIIKKNIFVSLKGFKNNLGPKGKKFAYGEETDLIIRYRKKYKEPIYYDNRLIVYHLVPNRKMKISYFIKSFFISGITYKIIKISNEKKKFLNKIWFNSVKKIFNSLLNIIKLPLRDRSKYPYWQNYFIEKILQK